MSASDRKVNLGWFGKTKTHEVAKATPCYLQTPLAVPATLYERELPDNLAAYFEATVIARQVGGAERALYKVLARAHRQGAGAVVTAVDIVAPIESDAAWACTFVASGNSVVLQVTGDAANAVQWFGRVEAEAISE